MCPVKWPDILNGMECYSLNNIKVFMKKLNPVITLAVAFSVFEISCSAIAGIFKAGMAVGIFIVVLIIVIIGAIIMKANKK
jgi:hypothetical protein